MSRIAVEISITPISATTLLSPDALLKGLLCDGDCFCNAHYEGGHLEQGTAKTQHSAALAKVNDETIKANRKLEAAGKKPLPLPLPPFEPYVMRHTALTRMAPLCDAFTLARIAGHSSITITQRYCHPQADAIEAAFSKFGSREVVTDAGHRENRQLAERSGTEMKTGA